MNKQNTNQNLHTTKYEVIYIQVFCEYVPFYILALYLEKDIPPRSDGYVKGKHSYIIYAINIIIIFKKMSIEARIYILPWWNFKIYFYLHKITSYNSVAWILFFFHLQCRFSFTSNNLFNSLAIYFEETFMMKQTFKITEIKNNNVCVGLKRLII